MKTLDRILLYLFFALIMYIIIRENFDYTIQEMDNNQSMQFFLDCIGATEDNIDVDDGTQVVVKHPDFDHKLVIDSGGLGDFYSHGYNVTLYSETVISACV